MRLKDYGNYVIILSHLGNRVIKDFDFVKDISPKYLKDTWEEQKVYAYLLVSHGTVYERYGTCSHVVDYATDEVLWDKL